MAIEVETGKREKVVLDFWISNRGNEYITARKFTGDGKGQWFPKKTNGMFLTVEEWNSIIPKLKEMIYYKTAPAGAPPYEGQESEETPPPSGDDF